MSTCAPDSLLKSLLKSGYVCNTEILTAATLDWLEFSLPDSATLEALRSLLHTGHPWESHIGGARGYSHGLTTGHISIHCNGRPGRALLVRITGDGCRELEHSGAVDEWPAFLKAVAALGPNWLRVDVALDDRKGVLSMPEIEAAARERRYASPLRKCRVLNSCGTASCSLSVYFGRRAADVEILIYDKASRERVPGPWVRVELRGRSEKARKLVEVLCEDGMNAGAAVLYRYLDFKQAGTQSQRERHPTALWWRDFLGEVEKLRLSAGPRERSSVDRTVRWLFEKVAASLARAIATYGPAFIDELLAYGAKKQSAAPIVPERDLSGSHHARGV